MSTDVISPAVDASPLLPNDPTVLQQMLREVLVTLQTAQRDNEQLRHRLDQLLRRLYGPKAERFDPNQPWLIPALAAANVVDQAAEPTAADETEETSDKPKRKGHGRKPLPKDLPRRRQEHTLPEAQRLCPCCGEVCQKFGEDISEQLDYQPASLFVWQHVRFKYACPKCHDHVTAAAVPGPVLNKGLPGPGLLAQIVASKYADHLPLHRLDGIPGRYGVDLARSTLCGWMGQVAKRLRPVVDLMADLVRQSKMLHPDATKMP